MSQLYSAIADAFATRLGEFAADNVPALPVIFPGRGGTPPASGIWLEAVYIPNETQNYGTADDGPHVLMGLFQVNVCDRPGLSPFPAIGIAEDVIAHFAKGTALSSGFVERTPWVAALLEEDDRVTHPVTIRWRA